MQRTSGVKKQRKQKKKMKETGGIASNTIDLTMDPT